MEERRIGVVLGHLLGKGEGVISQWTAGGHGKGMEKATLSSHVLDTASGSPAKGLPLELCVQGEDGEWVSVERAITNDDGRAKLPAMPKGSILRVRFETETYFQQNGVEKYFYPYADIVFVLRDAKHHHIPLLLSPFGYSTYRGS
mmetsp:Transcript_18445/g.52066  ORF Transcript_18445/g.52066 Transcript_18445/m.52066 type:complete len:145 (+) Transcript_18445:137-571(+)